MKKRNLIIVEPLCYGGEHLKFNYLLIKSILKITNNNVSLSYIAEKNHCEAIKKEIGENSIKYIPVNVDFFGKSKISKIIVMLYALIYSYIKMGKIIFFSSDIYVLLCALFFYKTEKIVCVVHSYFPILLSIIKKYELFTKICLLNFKYVVVRSDLISTVKLINNKINIDYIEHPVEVSNSPLRKKSIVEIGFIGRASKEKGFDVFQKIKKINANAKLKFVHIGPKKTVKIGGVYKSKGFISDEDFKKKMKKLSFVFYANRKNAYKYIASGVIFDAIGIGVPILGMKDVFVKYLEKKFGPIGVFQNNFYMLNKKIKTISRMNIKKNTKIIKKCDSKKIHFLDRVKKSFEINID